MRTLVVMFSLVMACGTQPTGSVEDATRAGAELEREAQGLGLDDCVDGYRACTDGCPFTDVDCILDCVDLLRACIDSAELPTGTPPAGTSRCAVSVSVNGESRQAECTDGDCVCTADGVEVGQCADNGNGCDLDTGCCAALF